MPQEKRNVTKNYTDLWEDKESYVSFDSTQNTGEQVMSGRRETKERG